MATPSAQFTLVSTQVKDLKLPLVVFLAFALLLGVGLSASATTITLNFNTLPSAQGWTYESSGIAEGSVFSVNGSTLTQTTVGDGFGAFAYYDIPGLLDPTKPFSIDVSVRIFGEEFGTPGAFGVAARAGTLQSIIFFGESAVRVYAAGNVYQQMPIDGTVFHDYFIQVNPGAGTWTLDIDGTLAMTGLNYNGNIQPFNFIYLGDIGTAQNGNAEIGKYVFTQNSTVPEPGNMMMFGTGVLALAGVLRRKINL